MFLTLAATCARLSTSDEGIDYAIFGEHVGLVRAWQVMLQDAAMDAGVDEDSRE